MPSVSKLQNFIHSEPIERPGVDDNSPNKKLKLEEPLEEVPGKKFETDHIRPLSQYHLRPKTGLDRSMETFVEPAEYLAETSEVQGFPEALQEYKDKISQLPDIEKAARDAEYPKIVFLGTGSCIPNKTRNVSGILIHIS